MTATSLGFESLTNSGRSEYLVVYGGLQLGLGLAFGYFANQAPLHRAGMPFALAVHGPIVAYRAITVFAFRPVQPTTIAVGSLEAVMLATAAFLWFARVRGSAA